MGRTARNRYLCPKATDMKPSFLLILALLWPSSRAAAQPSADLSGPWQVTTALSPTPREVCLPTTLDQAGIGTPTTLQPHLRLPDGSVNKAVMRHLTRRVSYIGPATYERTVDVPRQMAGRPLLFEFERVLWLSRLYVDGHEVGPAQESLSTPHVFSLPRGLAEGRHRLRLVVDNRKQVDLSYEDMAHAYTNETQTMWNGVLGRMRMSVAPRVTDVQVYPDVERRQLRVVLGGRPVRHPRFRLDGRLRPYTRPNDSTFIIPVGRPRLWNEFTPYIYRLTVQADGWQRTVRFGMRRLESRHGRLLLNGERIFLRATLECCIFPLTGCPPTTEEGWRRVFGRAKAWGLNSLRFHSYCPPEAAFSVADEMGFYLQVELPNWTLDIGSNPKAEAYFYREFERIWRAYGNHPSFCFMTPGNELQRDFNYLNTLCRHMKQADPRHLYATTTFTFEKGHGGHPEPEDQFYVTQWTDRGWVRGQGVFDEQPPCFRSDYDSTAAGCAVPLISHEIGQYSVYPNLRETDKYTGTLDALNFKAIRRDLEQKGLLQRADDYTQASGRLAVKLYKEEIERALKTRDFSGYQLLGLQDFPGQGTALVGLVDAFWDSKGLCTERYFRQFCAPVVPLARFDRATWSTTETFRADLEVANYSPTDLTGHALRWAVCRSDGTVLAQGRFAAPPLGKGRLNAVGSIAVPLSAIADADRLTLRVRIVGTDYANTWDFWAYAPCADSPGIVVTTSPDEAIRRATAGERVLLHPARKEQVEGLEGKFLPVFWSPVHFPKQAGTMGLLLRPRHPALAHFPTDLNADWQWWNIVKRSRVMVLDSLGGVQPLIESVDNFVSNRHLALLFEARLGRGGIVVSSTELDADLPEMRHLRYSLTEYMRSPAFAPRQAVDATRLHRLFAATASSETHATSIYE